MLPQTRRTGLITTTNRVNSNMKIVKLAMAALAAGAVSLPVSAGTLKLTFKDPTVKNYGPNVIVSLTSPTITFGFANAVDYSALGDPASGPKFGHDDLVFVDWIDIGNMASPEQNPAFENPPLTQAFFDTLTETFTDSAGNAGLFAPVTGTMTSGADLFFVQPSFVSIANDDFFVRFALKGTFIEPTGNWDSDGFNDAATWDFGLTSIEWDASATSFEAAPSSPVPLPAGLPLLLAGLGAFALARRRR